MDIGLHFGLLAYRVWTDAYDIPRQAFGLFAFCSGWSARSGEKGTIARTYFLYREVATTAFNLLAPSASFFPPDTTFEFPLPLTARLTLRYRPNRPNLHLATSMLELELQ